MNIETLLKPEAVKIVTSATSKKRLLQEVGDLMETAYNLTSGLVVEALLAREALGPTGVGHGVAPGLDCPTSPVVKRADESITNVMAE